MVVSFSDANNHQLLPDSRRQIFEIFLRDKWIYDMVSAFKAILIVSQIILEEIPCPFNVTRLEEQHAQLDTEDWVAREIPR